MINNLYSKKVQELISNKEKKLIIPDLIIVKEGIACGDKLILSCQIDNNVIRFNFSTDNACALSKAVCFYIEKEFNLKSIFVVNEKIINLYNRIKADDSVIFQLFDLDYEKYSDRIECLISPIKLFISFLNDIMNSKEKFTGKPNTFEKMECDACTGSCRINWKNEETKAQDHHNGNNYETKYLKKWLPYGKVTLTKKDIKKLPIILESMNEKDYQFLSDYTMNSFVLNHALKYSPKSLNVNWKATCYLIQKTEVTTKKFEKIIEYIKKSGLNIYCVKGYVSQKYYEDPALRIHSDFDLISEKEEDAFKLTHYLLNDGFVIRPNLFSIKEMFNKSLNKNCLCGHFHLQKVIDDMYNFEIDLTFPGFPINRVELFCPKVIDNSITIENQIVITLLHLFKHFNIYMKDINDLYYMLHREIDLNCLKELIESYKLISFFELAVSYIKKNYKTDKKIFDKIIQTFNINLNILNDYTDWPYNLDSHLKIKQLDFYSRSKVIGELERTYLFPIVMFKQLLVFENIVQRIKGNYKIINKSYCIYQVEKSGYIFFVTNIGIFIENYIDTSRLKRTKYLKILEEFLLDIGNPELFSIPYATEHFYVRVI